MIDTTALEAEGQAALADLDYQFPDTKRLVRSVRSLLDALAAARTENERAYETGYREGESNVISDDHEDNPNSATSLRLERDEARAALTRREAQITEALDYLTPYAVVGWAGEVRRILSTTPEPTQEHIDV